MAVTNLMLAELLARASDEHEGNKRRALKRASGAALTWGQEAAEIAADGELTELTAVGPWVAARIEEMMQESSPAEPPPVRRGFSSLASARATVAAHPEWKRALRADLQMHTTYSDGRAQLEGMAQACVERGYEYMAVTDHSKGLAIAGGMNEQVLARQGKAIALLNERLKGEGASLRILRGIEMNLSPAGEGDMEPAALADLDLVLGSFHSQLRRTEDQTDRYLAGLNNPHVHVLGHPRCRMWDRRPGLTADWERVFALAARLDKAVEFDAHPNRQDIGEELLPLAIEAGARISIGTDAHDVGEVDFIDLALAAVIEAGTPRQRILNFMPLNELTSWARSVTARMS